MTWLYLNRALLYNGKGIITMEKLSYKTLEDIGYDGYLLKDAKEKVLQFGEGNFLRAFVDYWFDLANEKADWNGKCCLVQPIAPGLAEMINEQDGLYTLHLRGSVNGEKVDDKRIISSVSRCLNPYQEEGFNRNDESCRKRRSRNHCFKHNRSWYPLRSFMSI